MVDGSVGSTVIRDVGRLIGRYRSIPIPSRCLGRSGGRKIMAETSQRTSDDGATREGFIHTDGGAQERHYDLPEPRTCNNHNHIHNQVAGFRVDDRPRAMPIVPLSPLFCHSTIPHLRFHW